MKKTYVRILLASVFFVGLLTLSASAFAQANADLQGVTRDTNGAVVPNVKVKARNTATNLTRETQSDDEGRYAFPSLPIGGYEVSGTSTGFQPASGLKRVMLVATEAVFEPRSFS